MQTGKGEKKKKKKDGLSRWLPESRVRRYQPRAAGRWGAPQGDLLRPRFVQAAAAALEGTLTGVFQTDGARRSLPEDGDHEQGGRRGPQNGRPSPSLHLPVRVRGQDHGRKRFPKHVRAGRAARSLGKDRDPTLRLPGRTSEKPPGSAGRTQGRTGALGLPWAEHVTGSGPVAPGNLQPVEAAVPLESIRPSGSPGPRRPCLPRVLGLSPREGVEVCRPARCGSHKPSVATEMRLLHSETCCKDERAI